MLFTDVAAHLRSQYALLCDEPTWIGLEEHGHRLRVGAVEVLSAPGLILVVEIGAPVHPTVALRQNAALPIGAIADEDGATVLRHLVPLAGLTLADVDRMLHLMLGAAIGLRRLSRPPDGFKS